MSKRKLEQAGVQTPRLDTIIILETVLKKDRSWILANPDLEISDREIIVINNLLRKRCMHEPLAYMLGKVEFYNREFIVGPEVLVPRPESEAIIDLLKDLVNDKYSDTEVIHIADVGTGSGALGITARLELHNSCLELLDIDNKATTIAKTNVDILTPNLPVIVSDLLVNSRCRNDIILCNLPYVPDDYPINSAAKFEPAVAIFGGKDGLNVYRRLFDQIKKINYRPLYIICESLPVQHDQLASIAFQSDYILAATNGFVQLFAMN
jgi:release factor glutamine methyltransferase